MENKLIPLNINYSDIKGLRQEAIQKLNSIRPTSIGQAMRISGVSPADISVLILYIELFKRNNI
ncbi:tRNA uridine 5-carboxymethylaminomethyl modification enzyme mnmG [Candidatus Arthromitus sp. SFB-5]|nr:tRNA uridine 5-carboxymethylaminomethyl modification enzyme mnmG [Candidatus Arthromitus sp. SFB-5]